MATENETNNIRMVQYQLPGPEAVVRADEALEQAKAIVIDSNDMMEIALEERALISKQVAIIEEERMAITRPLDASKKAVMDFFKKLTEPRAAAIVTIDTAVRKWRGQEQARLALEHAQREELAAVERKRLEDEAAAAIAAGKPEVAAVLEQTAALVVANPVETVAKVAGTSFPKTWKGEVEDVKAFLLWLAEHPDRHACIEWKQAELNNLARSVKKAIPVPGFTATEVEGIRGTGKSTKE